MSDGIRVLAPCGMLGYGFPLESFQRGLEKDLHGIVVDAGSTDAGPHKLGAGVPIVSSRAAKKDLEIIITHGIPRKIPIIIGSAGGAGAKKHVEWTLSIIQDIITEHRMDVKIGVIWSDFTQEEIKESNRKGLVKPLSNNISKLEDSIIDETDSIVAQMGHEPIVKALQNDSDIIVCGRAYDPSPFAAIGAFYGKDLGLSYHMGKILECGALCAEPGTTKDSILGIIKGNSFTVQSMNPKRRCDEVSVAAHTFYEKEHPYILKGPGFTLNLQSCEFKEIEKGIVEVRNSQYIPDEVTKIKIEGARKVAYRSFGIAGVRDPLLIQSIDEVEELVVEQVTNYYKEIDRDQYKIHFYNYGKNAVLGDREPNLFSGYEIGVLYEVIAKDQELADSIASTVRSTFLHYGYNGRKSTAGNLAFPFAPSEVSFGPVYEFSIYHLMEIYESPFKIEYI